MLKIDNITFSYGDNIILKDFSLNIKKGDKLWLYGQSGCGKTTLLRLILGLEKPQRGNVINLEDLKPSVVFQENRLLPFKTALQNILLVNNNYQKAVDNLTELGLGDNTDTPVSELSGGMKRRVAIARALTADFDYLILDEPFTGLDKDNIEIAAKHILKIAQDKPIILVTHSEEEAALLGATQIKW